MKNQSRTPSFQGLLEPTMEGPSNPQTTLNPVLELQGLLEANERLLSHCRASLNYFSDL